ncbi:PREDICTED: uncharacterized protein LOC109225083 [Nicotiana attenuata]|uniref:uncharacterized protein LOC109225083 n=1 Tax=Nicotiana attenuata TaxID=49451 RepID=UPI0009056807|nr:PREDICTED: uncharacterized protein LOC109225083 [Nicotiana attenuata]
MVQSFFNGHELPRFVTHTNLVLLPKKKEVVTFSGMRHISLSNFVNKIFSRVVHERLVGMLPSLISDEQAGFVKGRSIVENVLLTQELITDIRLRTKAGPNLVIKLDMAKAYDQLSWLFLSKVLRKMGLGERFIGLVFGIVSNNWYSILLNGQPHGFFRSTRGVKQGDPLLPTLHILAAEALSRGLKSLHSNLHFRGFGLPKWSPKINHLAYADDTIIFSSSDARSLKLIMQILSSYEAASGQLINKSKSAVYMHHSARAQVIEKVQRITGIPNQEFPFTYLGCPIFYLRRRMNYYQDLITKVMNKLQNWKGKLLSIGGRAVLITHVLQSMPIYLLSAVNPPAYVINRLHKIFAQFFWSDSVGTSNRHRASWNNLCLPCEEGGVGFRSLHDMATALFCKLWWNFRTKPSLWSSFMCQKYCKKLNPIIVPWRGGLGALYFVTPLDHVVDEEVQNIYDVVEEGQRNEERLREILPEDLASHILQNIQPPTTSDMIDKPVWMLENRGEFSVKSAWEYLRRRQEPRNAYRNIWVKGLPFKISFFMWKFWKNKLPLDDFYRRLGYQMASRCWCCLEPKEETLQHLFFTSPAANTIWKYFLGHAGILIEGVTLHQAIIKCWTVDAIQRMKPIMQALPAVIIRELWKRRNGYKYGDAVTVNRVIYQISTTMQCLVKLRKPGIQNPPHKWPDLIRVLEQYTPQLQYTKVLWEMPSRGWIKVNTDGASRGNPGRSSIGYVVRNEEGDVLYACGKEIQEGSNSVAEARAILEAMKYCVGKGYEFIELNTDSMMLKNVIDGVWKIPWNISAIVEEIKHLLARCSITVAHTLREENSLADHIANYALDHGKAIVSMPYPLEEFQLVVLVLSTHSTGRKPWIGTSIEAGFYYWQAIFSELDKQHWQAILWTNEVVGKITKVEDNTSETLATSQPFSDKDVKQETEYGAIKKCTTS